MATTTRVRKVLTLEEQKLKYEADLKKLAEQASKIAVLELKDYISNLSVANVGSLFEVVKANKKGVKDLDILITLAEIGKVKVDITEKPKATRAKRSK